MALIKLIVNISATNEVVYDSISQVEGIKNWWTEQTYGGNAVGDSLEFRFDQSGFFKMRIEELESNKTVVWECTDGDKEWIGTILTFELIEQDGKTLLKFEHNGWKETTDFMDIAVLLGEGTYKA